MQTGAAKGPKMVILVLFGISLHYASCGHFVKTAVLTYKFTSFEGKMAKF